MSEDTRDEANDLSRASRGDEAASARALAAWVPRIERYLRRRASRAVLARESAADLAQSVCREALERLRRGELEYRGEAALKQWLFGAADLKVQNRQRYWGAARRAAAPGAAAVDPALLAASADPTPSADAARAESRAAFLRALEALDERQRVAVRLFHLEGRSHADVALSLGIGESHSRTLVARALARLARLLSDDPPPPSP